MSFDLTDRGIKLLYRQRGSHSRNLDPKDDDLVIKGPAAEEPADVDYDFAPIDEEPIGYSPVREESMQGGSPINNLEVDAPVAQSPPAVQDIPWKETRYDFPQSHEEPQEHATINMDDDVESLVSYYNFDSMPLRQLNSSITSITSVDVLVSMFTNLFQNDLIPQAMSDFEKAKEKRSKMSYKLDVRIFESVIDQLVSDLRDIIDINMSNNELCYQLRQIVSAKEDLSEELVKVRRELQALKCGGEMYQLQQESNTLDERVNLNKKLNSLKDILDDNSPVPKTTSLTNLDDFCNDINPYNGVLSKIQSINQHLQEEND